MARAWVAVGSNLGDRSRNFKDARRRLEVTPGIYILKSSSVYETEPVGGPPQGKFFNAVWEIETALDPEWLMKRLLAIEIEMGRKRREPLGPRIIDLDLLDYDGLVLQIENLTLPHPRLHEREFVLKPRLRGGIPCSAKPPRNF